MEENDVELPEINRVPDGADTEQQVEGEQAQPSHRLPFWHKIVYGMGDLSGNGSVTIINFFYVIFLTDVVILSPALASLVFFAMHAWTAIIQIWVGHRSDRANVRFGRRRRFFLYAGWMMLPAFFFMWLPLPLHNEAVRLAYYTCASLLFFSVYNVLIVPYNALGAEIARNYDERSSLMAFRFVFSGLAAIACTVVPMIIVGRFSPDIRLGYGVMAVSFGILFTLPWYLIFAVNKEPHHGVQVSDNRGTSFHLLRILLSNRTVRFYIALISISALTINLVCAMVAYYVKYCLNRTDSLPLILFILVTAQTVCIPLFTRLSYRIGKAAVFIVGSIFCCLGGGWLFLMPGDTPSEWVLVAFAIAGAGAAGVAIVPYSMLGDIADVGALVLGRRMEGLMSGIHMFVANACSAFARISTVVTLGLTGFLSPIRRLTGTSVEIIAQPQPTQVLAGIRILFTLLPIVLFITGMVIAWRFPLTSEIHHRLSVYLHDQGKSVYSAKEKKWLLDKVG